MTHKGNASDASLKATVQVAGTLSEQDKESLTVKIKQKFEGVDDVVFESNEELIAGIRVQYRDFVYEDSVRERLQQLQ